MIEKNMIVQVDGKGSTFYLVTDIWNSTIKLATLVNLDTLEQANNEPLSKLHPAGWAANEVLRGRKKELKEKIALIDQLLENLYLGIEI